MFLINECKRKISILTLLIAFSSQYSKGKRKNSSLLSYGVSCKKVVRNSKNTLASSMNSSPNPSVVDDLHKPEFKFINNGGHPDEVVNDQNFRKSIDSCIAKATNLKHFNFKHMGNGKLKSI